MAHKRNSVEVPELEKLLAGKKKKYVRYEEGAVLYSMGKNSFRQVAQDNGLTENNSGYRGFRQAPSKKGCDQNCTQLSWTLLELVGGFIEKRVYFVDVVGV